MSVFDSIMSKVFGHAGNVGTQPATVGGTQPAAATGAGATGPIPATSALHAGSDVAVTPDKGGQPVDVAAVLMDMSSKSSQTLNWRESIVDLMKLLGLDSSLNNRKQLAHELGYTGDTADSAAMNVWLHNQVMHKLAENGGQVPADLLRT